MAYTAAVVENATKDGERSMFILNQKKDLLVKVSDVKVQNAKITATSQQHPMGITLGKYHSAERAQSVLQSLVADAKASTKFTYIYEMPRE